MCIYGYVFYSLLLAGLAYYSLGKSQHRVAKRVKVEFITR